ncbi:hypothetical protein QMK33_18775 [Hymenobacter sp. H14-R3]|uniref:hypothetical protein n=1 Tax=Hymenobacter sp. H14-R3 TaxID=3046308 RepID=UPI0024BB3EBA|nr:hypothetical protein [Hymenobacter sp. H14-R3]MDJ0367198.1 hypothetical protein [Hymenobacter sp. H14-R3]
MAKGNCPSCAATRPAPTDASPAVDVAQVRRLSSLTRLSWLPTDLNYRPPRCPPRPAPARASAGRGRYQAQNLALSSILPARIKNNSVAPGAVATTWPASTVATGGSPTTDAHMRRLSGGGAGANGYGHQQRPTLVGICAGGRVGSRGLGSSDALPGAE